MGFRGAIIKFCLYWQFCKIMSNIVKHKRWRIGEAFQQIWQSSRLEWKQLLCSLFKGHMMLPGQINQSHGSDGDSPQAEDKLSFKQHQTFWPLPSSVCHRNVARFSVNHYVSYINVTRDLRVTHVYYTETTLLKGLSAKKSHCKSPSGWFNSLQLT